MTKNTKTTREAAVNAYLGFVADPASIVDQDAIDALRAEFDAETVLTRKAQLHAQLRQAEAGDPTAVTEAFVNNAMAYAAEAGIEAVDLLAMGVTRAVLQEAGFTVPRGAGGSGTRKASVPREVVEAAVLATKGEFTIAQIAEQTNASPAGARTAVLGLFEAGSIKETTTLNQGRGKPAMQYKVA